MSIKTVTLMGAGGNLGPAILEQFLKSDFDVTVLSRKESTKTFPSSVKVIKTDYSVESLSEAFSNQDAVISIVGVEGFEAQTKIIDAAVKAGVKRFFPSEFGSDTANKDTQAIVPFFATKAKVVDYLKSKESKDFSWTGLVTGPFFDWGMKFGFFGFDFQKKNATIWDGGDVPVSATNLSTIGAALVKLLSTDEFAKSANKYVYIDSYTTTQNELLKILQKLTGTEWAVERTESKKVIPVAHEKLGKGDFSAILTLIQAATFGEAALGDFRKVQGGLWSQRLGLPKQDLETELKSLLD